MKESVWKKEGMKMVVCEHGNWDIYDTGTCFAAIAKVDGCEDSYFGDINHVIKLIFKYKSYSIDEFTPYGLRLLYKTLKRRGYHLRDLFTA